MRLSALFIAAILLAAVPLHAEDIHVAAASDLNFAMKELIPQFERASGYNVRLTLGSSGNFYAQIQNGAPYDVLLSADVDYARRLEQSGRAVPGSIFVYAVGAVALWAPKTSKLDLNTLGMQALVDPSVRKIAIANPEHAPYGRAAVAAMQHAKVYERVKNRLALGENIAQAAQFVESGAADIGVIALSIATSAPMREAGSYWIIPRDTYPPIEQGAALLQRGGSGARAFLDWLRSAEARKILSNYGLE